MYNGVLAALAGEAWLFRSVALLEYAAMMFTLFHLVVVVYEEPALGSQFGAELSCLSARGSALGVHRSPVPVASAVATPTDVTYA